MAARKDTLYEDLSKEILKHIQTSDNLLPTKIQILLEEIKENNSKYGLVWSATKAKEQFQQDIDNGDIPYIKEVPELHIHKITPTVLEASQVQIHSSILQKKKPPKKNKSITNNLSSVTYNTKANILIEGDNYHSLTILQATHKEKIDVIYIDPPYNTGNKDFKYNDRYVDMEDGYRHSKWLSFISTRLELAKNLLTNKGVIFISIDDNEFAQLKLICDEIFGEENKIATLIWQSKDTVSNDAKFFSKQHEYIFCYAKNIKATSIGLAARTEKMNSVYKNPDFDSRGPWLATPINAKSGTEKGKYTITFPNHVTWTPPNGTFPRYNQDRLMELYADNRLYFGKSGSGIPQKKTFLSEVKNGVRMSSILSANLFGSTRNSNAELAKLIGRGQFDNPKPTQLIKNILSLFPSDITVLDFFAGSGTTGQAVIELNEKDHGNRQFILCTNNENDICKNVTYKRIQKVIEGNDVYAGTPATLKYYQIDFFKRDSNILKFQQDFTNKINDLILLKENFHDYTSQHIAEDYSIYQKEHEQVMIINHTDNFLEYIDLHKNTAVKSNKIFLFNYFKNNQYDMESDLILLRQFQIIFPHIYIEVIPKEIINTILGALS